MFEPNAFTGGRHAGALVPLSAIPSGASWGIGEIADLPHLAAWLQAAGLGFVQLLPVSEIEAGQNSPYSALTAMAIDPIFVALRDVPDFAEAGGESALDGGAAQALGEARSSAAVHFAAVRAAKAEALRLACGIFESRHVTAGSDRAAAFAAFADRERWWLGDYALFRALHDEQGGRYWRDWPAPLRDREPGALDEARRRLERDVRFYQYVQWLADQQWQQARRACAPVGLFGDFPFMVNGHSADVWSRQHEFLLDASVGVPPQGPGDPGQDWGLPACRWDVMEQNGFAWLQARVRRSVALYDGFRIDHLVGFYRTYVRERDGSGTFHPHGEEAQLAHGERLMRLFADGGARLLAEDLGVVPDFVRASLARLRIAGMKVLRWEREWEQDGQPFRDPAGYPPDSVAISGTHDTETLAGWWDSADEEERRACLQIPALRDAGLQADAPFSERTRDALLRAIFASGSSLAIVTLQDVFGWRDRINTPAVVNEENWTWKLPWPSDALPSQAAAAERVEFLRAAMRETGRG